MKRRFVAGALLAILTVLGALDLLEDTGLIQYSTNEMDRSVEDVLDNYGEAIRAAENVSHSSSNLSILGSYSLGPVFADLTFRNPGYSFKRKHTVDFAKSSFSPFTYSQVFRV
jgi:hypothetical protein